MTNQLRNRIVHSGDIPRDKNPSFEKSAQIAGAIVILVIDISRIYIIKYLLGICNSSVEKSERDVKKFFEKGEFRAQRVFDETYIDYMNRIEKEWIEDGYQSDFLQ